MKKNCLKTLLIFLILPVMVFSGCKKSGLPAINLSNYLKEEISVKCFDVSEANANSINLISQTKLKKSNLAQYLQFTINAEPVWFYKMYIDYISFYIYCNESSDYEMTIKLTISDVASEEDILKSSTESVITETYESYLTITPKAKKSIKCKFPIQKAVVNALGSTITIDISNSLELFSGDEDNKSTFKWLIYRFEIHGESRTYIRETT